MTTQMLIEEILKKYDTHPQSENEFSISTEIELGFGSYLAVYVFEENGELILFDYHQISDFFEDALKKPKIMDICWKNGIAIEGGCLICVCTELKQADAFINAMKAICKACHKKV